MRFLLVLFATVSLLAAANHPRLLLTPERVEKIKSRVKSDPLMKLVHGKVLERATEIFDERTCRHLIPDGKRLLAESRRALRNILACGIAWQTTNDPRYRERVIQELEAAVALQDWNPSHFLDTAEMATAVAIGYDWLFNTLSKDQRSRYGNALIQKALKARPLKYGVNPWWLKRATSNWSQVCSAGLIIASEAVQELDPALAKQVRKETLRLLEECQHLYSADGGYAEGPGYWHYGTNYHVMGLAALENSDQPLPPPATLKRSGDFILQLNGPTGYNFNFADGGPSRRLPTPAQSWIASTFLDSRQATYLRNELSRHLAEPEHPSPGGYFPLHLIWLPPPAQKTSPPALYDFFDGTQPIALARTGWTPDSAWLALKGGTGSVSHGHLDAGSFVYEARGVRWFHDLGADNYNLPGYFHGDRWQYLRLQNKSHNTLVIDDQLQSTPQKGCPLTPWIKKGSLLSVKTDLSTAYLNQAHQVIRHATFNSDDGAVRIRDEIKNSVGPVRWAVVTSAEIEFHDQSVILSQEGKQLVITREDKAGGSWQEFPLTPKSPAENQNRGKRLVGFIVEPTNDLTIEVGWKLK